MTVSLGSAIYMAVKPIFKIYMIIGVGFYLARKNVLTVGTCKNISALVIDVLFPCLVFTKIVTNIDNSDIADIGTIAILSCVIYLAQGVLVFAVGVLVGCPRTWYGGLLACGLMPNISDIPISYVQSMQNSGMIPNVDKGVSFICVYVLFEVMIQFNLGGFKLIEYDFKYQKKMKDIENEKMGTDNIPAINSSTTTDDHSSKISTSSDSLPQHDVNHRQEQEQRQLHQPEYEDNDNPVSTVTSLSDSIEESESIAEPASFQRHHANALSRLSSAVSASRTALSRRTSIASMYENDLISQQPQTMNDIVKVYSRHEKLLRSNINSNSNSNGKNKNRNRNSNNNEFVPPLNHNDNISETEEDSNSMSSDTKKIINKLERCEEFLNSFKDLMILSMKKPISITLVVSIVVCMVPWLKALFVETDQATLKSAPDGLPPLSFIMDFSTYLGNAQVPLGLLLLGATIGRLQPKNLPNGSWKTPVAVTIVKLFIFPVIGCALNSRIDKVGLFYGDDILYFISNINFCLPPATSLLFITAFYMPLDCENTFQMDCLAMIYIFHYIALVVCLPIVSTYTIKVSLGY